MPRGREQDGRSRRERGTFVRTALLVILVVAAAMLATAPALRNGLFWDDAIVLARQVPAMGDVRGAFFPPPGLPQFIPSYYRPVVFVTLLLDRAVWGTNLFGFHFDVWLLHALTAGLFFLLMRAVLAARAEEGRGSGRGNGWSAVAAGLLFAVHPVHAEAVAWIMGRADVLAALFTVGGLLAALRVSARSGSVNPPHAGSAGDTSAARAFALGISVAVLSALALLSKESAIVLPALAAIVLFGSSGISPEGGRRLEQGPLSAKRNRIAIGAATCGIVLALVLRAFAGMGNAASNASATVTATAPSGGAAASTAASAWTEVLARLPGALVFSMQRLVWPWPAPVFHAQVPGIGWIGALGALLFLALAAAAWATSRSGKAAALFTCAALLPGLAPALTRVSLSPVADRYLYMPSLGVCWMAGAIAASGVVAVRAKPGAGRARAAAFLTLVALSLWMVAAAWTTARAVASYRNDATFWPAALERAPSDPFLLMKHGQQLADAGRFAEGEAELRRALELGGETLGRSTRTVVLDNLGDIALRAGRLDEAKPWLDRALETGPGYAPAHLHLARWHRAKALGAAGDPSDPAKALAADESRRAVASVDEAIRLEPTSTEALLLRADLALDRGDRRAAIGAIREALRYMDTGADRTRIETALRALGG